MNLVEETKKLAEDLGEKAADFFGESDNTIGRWISGKTRVTAEAVQKTYDYYIAATRPTGEHQYYEPVGDGVEINLQMATRRECLGPGAVECYGRLRSAWGPRMRAYINHHTIVEEARNSMATRFLHETNAEWGLTMDTDMVYPVGDAFFFNEVCGGRVPKQYAEINAVDELLAAAKRGGHTIIGALYGARRDGGIAHYAEAFMSQQEAQVARRFPMGKIEDGVRPTGWVATGLMLYHRSVLEDMLKKFPEIERPNEASPHGFFRRIPVERGTVGIGQSSYGEDQSFCQRAIAAGHQPHVHRNVVCLHVGTKNFSHRE